MLMVRNVFISTADKALADFIWKTVENEPATKNVLSSREQIVFSSPKSTNKTKIRRLTIFLYNVTEQTETRKMKSAGDSPGKEIESSSLELHYLITPFSGNDEDDLSLVEELIHAFSATPLIASADDETNLGLKVKLDSLSTDELSRFWIALNSPLRLSVILTVSTAGTQHLNDNQTNCTSAVNQASVDMKLTVQLYQTVLKNFAEQSEGWKRRNIVVNQWILQDFKKSTDMTVDEMQTALINLGTKLEQGGSRSQFVKPLTQLAKYYEHQLGEMKGLHRVSHRQKENIEMISSWIRDVKSLAEALSK